MVGLYWKPIVAVRWTLTLTILVFARDHYELQIMILLAFSVTFQALLIGTKPIKNPGDFGMSVFNEVAISLYLYIVMLLTEFMGETGLRDKFGWALLVLVAGVVGINMFRVLSNLPSVLKNMYSYIKKKFCK